jgi:putative heme-binding domain-containing protein
LLALFCSIKDALRLMRPAQIQAGGMLRRSYESLARKFALFLSCFGISLCLGQTPPAPPKPPRADDYREFALRHEGDLVRGRDIFADDQRAGCARCHSSDGRGGRAGPDLFAVGDKYGRREIIDAILLPSATIAEGYNTTILGTKDGEEFQGIIKQVTHQWIELMGGDGKLVRIGTANIRERRTSEVSLMPEGLQSGLSLQEFTDLVEYLVSLKQPENAQATHHGRPNKIQKLPRPVALRPLIAEEMKFEHPVWFGPVLGQSNVFLVVEHETGKIWRLHKNTDGDAKTLFVDLGPYAKGTRGLLGMALNPRFRENHKYYFVKHVVENGSFSTIICEREAAPDLIADSGKPFRLVLRIDEDSNVHYGGGLAFGPDGFLYIGMGDSGPQEDPRGNGQNVARLLGKMLRVDVDHREADKAYSIPPDNPFIGRPDFRPEIWAYGLREPWRFSFDPVTGDLWAGDVGQDRYEEVDIIRRGENFGWNVYEGFDRFSNRYRRDGENFVPPVFAYARKFGVSVTGGLVYRANPRSSFFGVYICGDFESRRIFGLTQENRVLKTIREIGTAPQRIVSFGRGANGELYLVGYEGMIYQMDFSQCTFE